MVVNNFHIEGVARRPAKADAPLPIDTNTVLPGTIPREPLKAICRRNPQINQCFRPMKHAKFAQSHTVNIRRKLGWPVPTEELSSILVLEGPNHAQRV